MWHKLKDIPFEILALYAIMGRGCIKGDWCDLWHGQQNLSLVVSENLGVTVIVSVTPVVTSLNGC